MACQSFHHHAQNREDLHFECATNVKHLTLLMYLCDNMKVLNAEQCPPGLRIHLFISRTTAKVSRTSFFYLLERTRTNCLTDYSGIIFV